MRARKWNKVEARAKKAAFFFSSDELDSLLKRWGNLAHLRVAKKIKGAKKRERDGRDKNK